MLLSVLLAFAAAQSASAPPAPAVPPHRWTLDYSRSACTLARRVAGEDSPIMALNASLGREPGELLFTAGGSGLDQRLSGDVKVRLDNGDPVSVRARRIRRNERPVIWLGPLPDDFLDRVAGAQQLMVTKGNETLLTVPLGQVREAVEHLGRCNDDLLQSWGVDVAARHALTRLPQNTDSDWYFSLWPSHSTSIVLVADVSERGVATDCRVVISTLNAQMDRTLCNNVRHRAHFRPGLGADGRPVRSQYVTRVTWLVDTEGE